VLCTVSNPVEEGRTLVGAERAGIDAELVEDADAPAASGDGCRLMGATRFSGRDDLQQDRDDPLALRRATPECRSSSQPR
jgi:hypothetical protein